MSKKSKKKSTKMRQMNKRNSVSERELTNDGSLSKPFKSRET